MILTSDSVPKLAVKCENEWSANLRRRDRFSPGNQEVGKTEEGDGRGGP